jgi:hypothetical protein
MVIDFFGGNIAVPAKCGTRYFTRTGMECTSQSIPHPLPQYRKVEAVEAWKGVEWIVLRKPIEHLMSALHTDYLNDMSNIEYEIQSYFIEFSGGTHFYPHLNKQLYYLFKDLGIKPKVIKLSDVSSFVEGLGYSVPYNKNDYSFKNKPNWISKEECFEKLQAEYPFEITELIYLANKDNEFYEYLVDGRSKII